MAQLIGLLTVRNVRNFNLDVSAELVGDLSARVMSRLVAVEHEDYAVEVFSQQFLLRLGKCAAHERYDILKPGLVHVDAVEVSFDDDDLSATIRDRVVEIEKLEGFLEAAREPVLRLAAID